MTLLIYLVLSHQYRLPLIMDIIALLVWFLHLSFHEERKSKTVSKDCMCEPK